MTRTAGAQIGCQRPSRFWGLGCPKIYHEVEDTLDHWSSYYKWLQKGRWSWLGLSRQFVRLILKVVKQEVIHLV
ncbi:hypothetical protein, partial [Thiolapillus sp.]|uniref:hypothetical protein n=1 Tax=Thiolapillus sp. TaxID=2017437 RepID=UPI003AF4213D